MIYDHDIIRLTARVEMVVGTEKTASIVDALIGAPVGAVAARISAKEEEKDKATERGVIVGALLGFLAGQKAVADAIQGYETPVYQHPIAMSAAGGAGVGLHTRVPPLKQILDRLSR